MCVVLTCYQSDLDRPASRLRRYANKTDPSEHSEEKCKLVTPRLEWEDAVKRGSEIYIMRESDEEMVAKEEEKKRQEKREGESDAERKHKLDWER